jgi:hypothetical protein
MLQTGGSNQHGGDRVTKYKAKPIVIDNQRFSSQKEGRRYLELKLLFRAREIFDLALQPEFEFKIDGEKVFSYFADFGYTEKDGTEVIEDCKGFRTPVYKLKRKLIEKQYGIRIRET